MRMKNITRHSMRRMRRVAKFHNVCPVLVNAHGYTVHINYLASNSDNHMVNCYNLPIYESGPCTSENIKKMQHTPRGLTFRVRNVKVSPQGVQAEDQG